MYVCALDRYGERSVAHTVSDAAMPSTVHSLLFRSPQSCK